jgi:hypothetical protein
MIVITTIAVVLGIIFILHFLLLDIAAYFRGQPYIWGGYDYRGANHLFSDTRMHIVSGLSGNPDSSGRGATL